MTGFSKIIETGHGSVTGVEALEKFADYCFSAGEYIHTLEVFEGSHSVEKPRIDLGVYWPEERDGSEKSDSVNLSRFLTRRTIDACKDEGKEFRFMVYIG